MSLRYNILSRSGKSGDDDLDLMSPQQKRPRTDQMGLMYPTVMPGMAPPMVMPGMAPVIPGMVPPGTYVVASSLARVSDHPPCWSDRKFNIFLERA